MNMTHAISDRCTEDGLSQLMNRPESNNDYPAVLFTRTNHRVILCRDAIQYILQRSSLSRGTTEWRGLRFCVTRAALKRDWKAITGTPVPSEMASLTDRAPSMSF